MLETVRDDSERDLRDGTTAVGRPPERTLPELLAEHAERGELPALSGERAREAALALVAPLLLALLHQDALDGRSVRPLDVERLARSHAELVLAGLRGR